MCHDKVSIKREKFSAKVKAILEEEKKHLQLCIRLAIDSSRIIVFAVFFRLYSIMPNCIFLQSIYNIKHTSNLAIWHEIRHI
jgi:hypothetical protein